MKNVADPAHVYRVQLNGFSSILPREDKQTEPLGALALHDRPATAVLPCGSMSDDPEREYFSDWMTDDIQNGISQISRFFAIARNSSFACKALVVNVAEVGRELGVRHILEGSVRKAGNQRSYERPVDRRSKRRTCPGGAL